jgi:L-amino acid N-acyltransferase YncA
MTGGQRCIRAATAADAAACAAIYAFYVSNTTISFETEPPGPADLAERIAAANRSHAWLVLEEGGRVVGYAYATTFNPRAAYRWSCTVSVYLEPGLRRRGAGRALYEALFARLAERGYRTVLAGMTMPNEASEGLHRALGFVPVGTYRRVGYKNGGWHDVTWVQRSIGNADQDGDEPPAEPW